MYIKLQTKFTNKRKSYDSTFQHLIKDWSTFRLNVFYDNLIIDTNKIISLYYAI